MKKSIHGPQRLQEKTHFIRLLRIINGQQCRKQQKYSSEYFQLDEPLKNV